jgi:DNA repair protein RadC
MEYQISINHQFTARSEAEAREKAEAYVAGHLRVRPLPQSLISPLEVAQQCKRFRRAKQEHFCVFLLDTQNRVVHREIVSTGTLNAGIVHPREVFRSAIAKSAYSIIIDHNHPSGGLEPSSEDLAVTERLTDCGRLIGIELLDHVIVTPDSHMSFREKNLL